MAGLRDVFGCGGEEPEHLLNAFGCFVCDELLEVLDFAGGEVYDFGGVLANFGDHHIAQEACEFLGEVPEVVGVGEEVFDMVEYGIDIALQECFSDAEKDGAIECADGLCDVFVGGGFATESDDLVHQAEGIAHTAIGSACDQHE